ncbi:MAG: hypothetical protein PHN69_05045 [Candidatus Pacebacteria bacterium]|nr:hypothetical protein [Candidatus Paceibacterota bacterium]
MAQEVSKSTISLNLRPYCNLLYPYETVAKIDRAVLLDDVRFWADVLVEIDAIMAPSIAAAAAVAEQVPDDVEVITKCSKCGSSNLKYSTGKAKATGKPWHAFDCQDCSTTRDGKEYPTRNFTKMKSVISASEAFGMSDDEDIPF